MKDSPPAGRILIYSQSRLNRDPRVHRQIELLAATHQIIAYGKMPPSVPVARFRDLSRLIGIPEGKVISLSFLKDYAKRFGSATFFAVGLAYLLEFLPIFLSLQEFLQTRVLRAKVLRRLKAERCDLIIANDLTALAVCAVAKGGRRLLFDAHEYSPGQFPRGWRHLGKRAYARYLLRKYLPRVDRAMTIGYGIADLYEQRYGLRCEVVTNAPSYRELAPMPLREGKIRLVHQGLAVRKRSLETMIDVIRLLGDNFSLDFFLMPQEEKYYQELIAYAGGDPRIVFNEPVPMHSLPETLNRFDIGFRFYPPKTVNLRHGLPNKFFEFVQARLAVAVGPTPEARRFIERYGFGFVSEDFSPSSMARMLSSLSPGRIMEYKHMAHRCAKELSAEANNLKISALINELMKPESGTE